jgi:D-amino peptidase
MDSRATYETPDGSRLMPSLTEEFSGVILLGHHAMAGTLNGFLDHTMSSMEWFEYRINGQVVGEIGIEAAYAAHYGVPVIVVSGDETTAIEASAQLGEVECAVVKRGIGRNRAECLVQDEAHRCVRDAITRALSDLSRFTPWAPSLPAVLQLTYYRSDMADITAAKPGVERVDARTVRKQVNSLLEVRTLV